MTFPPSARNRPSDVMLKGPLYELQPSVAVHPNPSPDL